ncbi:MAG: gas vesicle protein [Chloroflexi bacterium]|nr:gas vesicle protein [Chloroflexota bacterium]
MENSTTVSAPAQATLVDLLDRVLDKGLVINADIVVSLAGVPLIGINLRAALAGVDTMMKFGLMEQLDNSMRLQSQASRGVSLSSRPPGNGSGAESTAGPRDYLKM